MSILNSNTLYKYSFYFLITYIIGDITITILDYNSRLALQIVATLTLLLMLTYLTVCGKNVIRAVSSNVFLISWSILVMLIVLYSGLAFWDIPTTIALKSPREAIVAVLILTTLLFFYIATRKKQFCSKHQEIILAIILVHGLVEIIYVVINPRIRTNVGVVEYNTSAGYIFVMILPLLLSKYKNESFQLIAGVTILTVLTGKRGALLICFVIILYYLLKYRTLYKNTYLTINKLLFTTVAIIGMFVFLSISVDSFLYRITTFQQDDGSIGSGRSVIWLTLLLHFWESDLIYKIFGSGYYSTIEIIGIIAHNDFLQFLIDYGILGLMLWITTIYFLWRKSSKITIKSNYSFLINICIIVLVMRGLFAGTIRTDNIYIVISLGYLLARVENIKPILKTSYVY